MWARPIEEDGAPWKLLEVPNCIAWYEGQSEKIITVENEVVIRYNKTINYNQIFSDALGVNVIVKDAIIIVFKDPTPRTNEDI